MSPVATFSQNGWTWTVATGKSRSQSKLPSSLKGEKNYSTDERQRDTREASETTTRLYRISNNSVPISAAFVLCSQAHFSIIDSNVITFSTSTLSALLSSRTFNFKFDYFVETLSCFTSPIPPHCHAQILSTSPCPQPWKSNYKFNRRHVILWERQINKQWEVTA